MSCSDKIDSLIAENNGYLFSDKAVQSGITRFSISEYVKRNEMERVANGVYITSDTWPDYYYILATKNGGIVYSHESALYIHGLAEREPVSRTVTVKFGYNAVHLKKQGVSVKTVIDKYYDIGISSAETIFGNTVPVYDKERTVCDIIRNKDNMDIQVFSYAIKQYMKSRDKNLPKLSEYARLFGISDKIRTYTEVML